MVELPVDIKLRLDFKQFPLKIQKKKFPRISNKQNTSELCVDVELMLKERLNSYRQHIRQPQLQQINVEGHIRTCGCGNFKIMPFFAIWEDNKILRESYEKYFIEKFKPALNKRHK